ncbi:MAG: formylglycine-generating enzyme family protein, partial [Nitrospirota bacterium]
EILNHPVINVSRDDEAYDDWAGMALPNKEILNHPVVCVSWDDAKAYADWASMQLPSEQDWEKAARGTDGRIYPWGDNWVEGYCNTVEAWVHEEGKGKTTRVGQYPADANSPYGCVDMAGNVWEWTDSLYVKGETDRVKRGGSFHRDQDHARTYSRFSDPPNTRLDHLGFRVARCLPP